MTFIATITCGCSSAAEAELAPIDLQRLVEMVGREMRGEGIGQAQRGGELRAEQAGAKHPQFHCGAVAGGGADAKVWLAGQQRAQLDHVLREQVGCAPQIAAQRLGDPHVGSRRTSKAQIDPPGKQGVERPELFGDHEGIVVGQHDPARADPDRGRGVTHVRQDHRSRPARHAVHRVMLGHPEPPVSGLLCALCQHGSLAQRLGDGRAFTNGDKVKDRKRDHCADGAAAAPNWSR